MVAKDKMAWPICQNEKNQPKKKKFLFIMVIA